MDLTKKQSATKKAMHKEVKKKSEELLTNWIKSIGDKNIDLSFNEMKNDGKSILYLIFETKIRS